MSSPLDPSLRRSCDRCHEQKVRCIRSSADLEEATAPCMRCRKAGAVCLYSPQLRAGRPPACKRARQTTTVPDSHLPASSSQPDDDPFSPSAFFTGLDSELAFEENPIPLLAPAQSQSQEDAREHQSAGPAPTTTTSSIDPVDSELKELGELARRIYRSAHAFSSDILPGAHPLSISSPAIHELSDAAFALIRRIARLCPALSSSCMPGWPPGAPLSPSWEDSQISWLACSHPPNDDPSSRLPSSLDTGLVLMVLACHQRLMSAFENVTLSVTHHLLGPAAMNTTSHTHPSLLLHLHIPAHLRRSSDWLTSGGYNGRLLSPLQSTQALLIVELLDHLLDHLDGAFRPLLPDDKAANSMPEPSSTQDTTLPSPCCPTGRNNFSVTMEQVSLCVETARAVLDTMQQRHGQLRAQLNELRRRTKDTGYY
ncbi:hypothetical protein BDV10DRAFT_134039 [Aspergillus recurvatus]